MLKLQKFEETNPVPNSMQSTLCRGYTTAREANAGVWLFVHPEHGNNLVFCWKCHIFDTKAWLLHPCLWHCAVSGAHNSLCPLFPHALPWFQLCLRAGTAAQAQQAQSHGVVAVAV